MADAILKTLAQAALVAGLGALLGGSVTYGVFLAMKSLRWNIRYKSDGT